MWLSRIKQKHKLYLYVVEIVTTILPSPVEEEKEVEEKKEEEVVEETLSSEIFVVHLQSWACGPLSLFFVEMFFAQRWKQ